MATQPILSIVRMVPWGSCGYRYVIAAGIGHPLLFRAVFRDTCEVFPDHPVIVLAESPTTVKWWQPTGTQPSGRSSKDGDGGVTT
jgi:tetraacyldisaccharide-1-P 4'-kinase